MDWYGCQKTRRRKPRISMRTNRREKDVRRLDRRLMRILEGTYPWCDGQNCKEEIPKEKSCSELQWRWSFSARTCIRVYGAECIGHEFNLAEGENTSSTIKKHPWKSLVCASAGTSPTFDLEIIIILWIMLWLCKMVLLNSLPQKVFDGLAKWSWQLMWNCSSESVTGLHFGCPTQL